MRETIFTDTGFWIALFDKRDKNHFCAKDNLEALIRNYNLCLSDFILFETITYLNCSIKRHDLAMRFLNKTQESVLRMLVVDEVIKATALKMFERYSDKDLSITDCTSFVLMNNHGITKYAGFDDHFRQMGFVCKTQTAKCH